MSCVAPSTVFASQCSEGMWTESINFGSQTACCEDKSFIILECLADQEEVKKEKTSCQLQRPWDKQKIQKVVGSFFVGPNKSLGTSQRARLARLARLAPEIRLGGAASLCE